MLLGFVWLLLREGPVDEVQAEVLRHTAASVAALLHEHLMGELTRNREWICCLSCSRQIVNWPAICWLTIPRLREHAAKTLLDEERFVSGPVAGVVIGLRRTDNQALGDTGRLALALGMNCRQNRLVACHAI